MKKVSRGFTLMELMIVIALAAVIMGIAAPNFTAFRQNARMTNTANDVLTVIVKARTEAIKRQGPVSICASANPTDAAPTCTDGSNVGLIAFADTDGNCERNGTETAVASMNFDHTMTAIPLTVKANGNCLSFADTGFQRDVAGKTSVTRLMYCDIRGKAAVDGAAVSAARGIIITRTGRAKITRLLGGGSTEDITTWTGALDCP